MIIVIILVIIETAWQGYAFASRFFFCCLLVVFCCCLLLFVLVWRFLLSVGCFLAASELRRSFVGVFVC